VAEASRNSPVRPDSRSTPVPVTEPPGATRAVKETLHQQRVVNKCLRHHAGAEARRQVTRNDLSRGDYSS
jgi:hypothetical protein